MSARLPCKTCPWRVDQDATVIPNFRLELAEGLANTCPDERGFGPDIGTPMMACHQSKPGEEIVCAGWLAVAGHAHPAARLNVFVGTYSPDHLKPPEGVALHASFAEMIEKLRATADGAAT